MRSILAVRNLGKPFPEFAGGNLDIGAAPFTPDRAHVRAGLVGLLAGRGRTNHDRQGYNG